MRLYLHYFFSSSVQRGTDSSKEWLGNEESRSWDFIKMGVGATASLSWNTVTAVVRKNWKSYTTTDVALAVLETLHPAQFIICMISHWNIQKYKSFLLCTRIFCGVVFQRHSPTEWTTSHEDNRKAATKKTTACKTASLNFSWKTWNFVFQMKACYKEFLVMCEGGGTKVPQELERISWE